MNKNRPGNTGRAMVIVPGGTARSLPTEIERNPAELLVRVVRCPPDKTETRTRLRTRLTRLKTRCEQPPVGRSAHRVRHRDASHHGPALSVVAIRSGPA